MDQLLAIFISWQFLSLCLGIAATTFVFRKLLEYAILNRPNLPGNPHSPIWRDLILPIAPVLTGLLVGIYATSYPFPDALGQSVVGRGSFGLTAGLLSGLVYRMVAGMIKSKLPVENTNESTFIKTIRESINKDPVDPTTDTEQK